VLYRELLPAPALRPVVRCFWHLADPACTSGVLERIVPDGCAEIVLNRAERFVRVEGDGPARPQARELVVGQIASAIRVAPTGPVDVLGIRFEPGGLWELCGVPMHELLDRDLCLGQVDARLRERLARAGELAGLSERVAAVEAVLARALLARERARGSAGLLVGAAVRAVERGAARSETIARAAGLQRRALERLFHARVGLSPRLFVRIRRLQGVLGALERGASWAGLAAAHGYADQSHLIRDFRLLAGTTPER
jgi:AraC-like DNA-binding protein